MKTILAVALTASILSVAAISNANAAIVSAGSKTSTGGDSSRSGGTKSCEIEIVKKLVNGKRVWIKKCDYLN